MSTTAVAPAGASVLASFRTRIESVRRRLTRTALVFAAAFALAFTFAQEVFVLTALPLVDAWQERAATLGPPSFYFRSLTEPFFAFMSQSFWLALLIASPHGFYQVWNAVIPANRSLRVWPLAAVSTAFFIGGVGFCYALVMPTAFGFLLDYATTGTDGAAALQPRLMIADYADFARRLMVGFGIVFELPVVIYMLARLGIVTHRGLWRFNRWAILLAFTVAAVLTPGPDVLSQVMMAVPLLILYNASIVVAYFVTRTRESNHAGSR